MSYIRIRGAFIVGAGPSCLIMCLIQSCKRIVQGIDPVNKGDSTDGGEATPDYKEEN